MSQIVRFYELGGPEVLRVEDAFQRPRAGEVLLQVQAIGLNRADSMFMNGRFLRQQDCQPAWDMRQQGA
jgi:NADPH:quinone reductase-like Zn-dependent oxidoreductase